MKLEPKHLSSYYPFDIIIKNSYNKGKSFNKPKKLKAQDLDLLRREKVTIKPILFPLTSLTKEITVNGETFVPLLELANSNYYINKNLAKKFNRVKYVNHNYFLVYNSELKISEYQFRIFLFDKNGGRNNIEFSYYDDKNRANHHYSDTDNLFKLFEWKFDVFGLIDAGLAEPVTENFNPYK